MILYGNKAVFHCYIVCYLFSIYPLILTLLANYYCLPCSNAWCLCWLQQYIQHLNNSLQEEMARHAPLYGAGLESLSMTELETISHIHEEGLRLIHSVQQRRNAASPLVGGHGSPQGHSLYPTTPPMPVGLPASIIQNNAGIQGNGHKNGAAAPWFNSSWSQQWKLPTPLAKVTLSFTWPRFTSCRVIFTVAAPSSVSYHLKLVELSVIVTRHEENIAI